MIELRFARPIPFVLLAAGFLRANDPRPVAADEPDRATALANALGEKDFTVAREDVYFLDDPSGLVASRFSRPRAIVRARRESEPADLHLVESRWSPEGRLLEITAVRDLSETSAVDEQQLTVSGERAAWTVPGGGKTFMVKYADLRGSGDPSSERWTRTKRWQRRISNWQRYGDSRGVLDRSFKLDPAAALVTLALGPDALHVVADGHRIRIPTEGTGEIEGGAFIREEPQHEAVPGNVVTWAVDRVRQSPWFTDDQMQAVKAIAFEGLDVVERMAGAITGDDGAAGIAEDLAGFVTTPPVEYTDPDTGWPPAPMEPMLSPALEDEGKWRAFDDDPFVLRNDGAPSPFVMGYVRTDQQRAYTRIYVLVWDPRQVELRTMSGTVEPKSATGETGTGLVPRKPEVLGRVLAGFNGGFQATHGEFGMVADGVVYLPPKPYAATVARMSDGSTGFGSWPNTETVPADVVDMRQNMTPLVMDGVINPYKRTWWGGVPPGWTDEARTVRSAVCLTKEGFAAYLYGASIDADHLAFAMQRARCDYGIHLDMNPGHTGLEFYRAAPEAELPKIDRPLDAQWEATGPVVDMPGWRFLGRRMLRYMGLMNFPRYIDRESRDFMYLTLRHVLPGKRVPTAMGPDDGEGAWSVKGLPQHGFPYAIATTWVRPDAARPETKVRLMKIDPRAVRRPALGDDTQKTVVVLHQAANDHGEGLGLWLGKDGFTISEAPVDAAERILSGTRVDGAARIGAALGIGGTDGMLYYAEVATGSRPAEDGKMLVDLLRTVGVDTALVLPESVAPAIGGDRDMSGHPVVLPARRSIRLVRATTPGARRIFTDTPIVPLSVWYPLQAKRVRYFRKPEPSTLPAGDGEAPPSGSALP